MYGHEVPVLKRLGRVVKIPISVDTTKAGVAEAALAEGASLLNDVSVGGFDGYLGRRVEHVDRCADRSLPSIPTREAHDPETEPQIVHRPSSKEGRHVRRCALRVDGSIHLLLGELAVRMGSAKGIVDGSEKVLPSLCVRLYQQVRKDEGFQPGCGL